MISRLKDKMLAWLTRLLPGGHDTIDAELRTTILDRQDRLSEDLRAIRREIYVEDAYRTWEDASRDP